MTNSELISAYEALRGDYAEYCAECRALGQERASFEVWADIVPDRAKADAQERMNLIYDNPDYDLDW